MALATACTADAPADETSGASDADQTGSDETGPVDPGVLVGSFQLQLSEPKPASGDTPATPGATAIFGKIYDGPTPEQLVWEPGTVVDACRLLTPRVPFCNTPCGGSAACVEDDTCQPYPTALDAGVVEVEGVATTDGATSFSMEPIADNYQAPVGTTLAYPAFAAGDVITLRAAGAEVDAFEVSTTGVAQLELTNASITLDAAADLNLTWTVSGGEDSTVEVKLDISHHGGTKGKIECETEDTGSLVIGAALVAELLDLGVSGFPTIVVNRTSIGSAATSVGRVDLEVSSSVERTVLIDGLTSCTDSSECPDGQTCQPDLRCA